MYASSKQKRPYKSECGRINKPISLWSRLYQLSLLSYFSNIFIILSVCVTSLAFDIWVYDLVYATFFRSVQSTCVMPPMIWLPEYYNSVVTTSHFMYSIIQKVSQHSYSVSQQSHSVSQQPHSVSQHSHSVSKSTLTLSK